MRRRRPHTPLKAQLAAPTHPAKRTTHARTGRDGGVDRVGKAVAVELGAREHEPRKHALHAALLALVELEQLGALFGRAAVLGL